MITCVTYDNLDKNSYAFRAQFRLRHECFIERQDYSVAQYNGMEFDQYDTPAAIYLVYVGCDDTAWGCSRLTPVSCGSMIKDLWPQLVDRPDEIFTPTTWEGTRFCIKKSLPTNIRQRICVELAIAYLEAGIKMGMEQIIGVMPPYILKRVFGNAGCRYSYLGKSARIHSGETIVAASMPVTIEALNGVKSKTNIYEKVIIDVNENMAAVDGTLISAPPSTTYNSEIKILRHGT